MNLRPLLIIIPGLALLFTGAIILSNYQKQRYSELFLKDEIKLIHLEGGEGFGDLRGAIFVRENEFILSSAPLIENPCGNQLLTGNEPIVDYNDIPYQYTISDLNYPFSISKTANSDTIFITKDGCQLSFKLLED